MLPLFKFATKAWIATVVLLAVLQSCSQFSPSQTTGSAPVSNAQVQQQSLAPAPQKTASAVQPVVVETVSTGPTHASLEGLLQSSRLMNARNDPDAYPSVVPPSFEQEKWNNRIGLFQSDSTGVFTSNFGWRRLNGKANFHNGVDVWVKPGTEILVPVSGEVVLAKTAGNQSEVIIRKGGVLHTLLHVKPATGLSVGSTVQRGQVVGYQSDYNHLEYATYIVPNSSLSDRSRDNAINPFVLHAQPHLVD